MLTTRLHHCRILLRPVWGSIFTLLFFTALIALLTSVPALVSRSIVDRAIPHHDDRLMHALVFALLLNAAAFAASSYLQSVLNMRISQRITRSLRVSLAQAVYNAPLAATAAGSLGGRITRLSADVDALDGVWSGTIVSALSNVTLLAVSLAFVLSISVPLGVVALVLLPVVALAVNRVGRPIYKLRQANRTLRDLVATLVAETMSPAGLAFIKSFSLERSETARLHELATELAEADFRAGLIGVRLGTISTISTMGTPALLWLLGFRLIESHMLTLGGLFASIALVLRLYAPATALANMQVQLSVAAVTLDRLIEYLGMPAEDLGGGETPPSSEQGPALEFEHVTLRYPAAAADVLRDASLTIAGGEFIVLAGASGAGKTSLVRMLPALLTPTSGTIRYDGVPYETLFRPALRAQVAYVAQDPFFMNGTVRDNLLAVKPDACDEELASVCAIAGLDQVVAELPERLEAAVGDRAWRLSGGQRQRLALARALLIAPRLIILDEATNALDALSEERLLTSLREAYPNATVILVTHRMTAYAMADQVLTIKGGRVSPLAGTAVGRAPETTVA